MKETLGIWTVRREAKDLGHLLHAQLGGELYLANEDAVTGNRDQFANAFLSHRQWVLVMTTGIAVRYLQGLLKDKRSDPGVVVIDADEKTRPSRGTVQITPESDPALLPVPVEMPITPVYSCTVGAPSVTR